MGRNRIVYDPVEGWLAIRMKALDHVAYGVRAGMAGGVEGIRRYFREEMTAEDALKFDGLLLRSKDELRFMAGSPESRFVERCSRMLRNLQGEAF